MISPSGIHSDLFGNTSLYAATTATTTNTPPRTPLSQTFPKLSCVPPPLQKLDFDPCQYAYQSPTSPTSSARSIFQDTTSSLSTVKSPITDAVPSNLLNLNLTSEIYARPTEPSLFSDLNDDIFSIPKATEENDPVKLELTTAEDSFDPSISRAGYKYSRTRLSPIQSSGCNNTWAPLSNELTSVQDTSLSDTRAQRLAQLLDTINFGLGPASTGYSSFHPSSVTKIGMTTPFGARSGANLRPNPSFATCNADIFAHSSVDHQPVWTYSWPRNSNPASLPSLSEAEPITPPPYSAPKLGFDARSNDVYDDPPMLPKSNLNCNPTTYPPSVPFYPDPLFALINPRPLPPPPIYYSRRHPALVVELFNAAKHVYVSELPHLVDEGMIRKAFRRFGRIDDIRLSKSKTTGQLNGVAYIKFTYADAVTKALNADGLIPVGSKKVRVARSDPMDSPTRKLFFANVWDMTEEDVYPICQQFGTVVQVDVVADRGMMYVHFAKLADAVNAHSSLQGLTINHRYVRVEFGQSNANFGSRLK